MSNECFDGMTVLVVDDEPMVLALTQVRLRQHTRMTVLGANDGLEALDILRAGGIDIVVADVSMPHIGGLELARCMKADAELRFIPIVLVTGCLPDTAIEEVFSAGADDFLIKPIRGPELGARLMAAARLRRLYGELQGKNRELSASLEELAATQQHILHLQKMEAIGSLAAGIAHEINTPTQYVGDNLRFLKDAFGDLRRIIGDVERMQVDFERGLDVSEAQSGIREAIEEADIPFLAEEIPRAVDQALDGVGRVATIVQAMRDFSHHGTAEKAPCELQRLIVSTATLARNEYKYVADLEIDLQDDMPLVVCDEGGIKQVILNLIVNAAHAIADRTQQETDTERGKIAVAAHCDQEWLYLSVSDTGTGITDAVKKRMFDPFYTTKQVGKGTGQGLAIVHNVVVGSHHGTIQVESTVGKGTTFHLKLPVDGKCHNTGLSSETRLQALS